jgi:hypothetical protein
MNRCSIVLFLLAAACSSEAPAPNAAENQAAPRPAPAPAAPAKDRLVEEKSDLLEFTYGWPAEAVAIPKLAARFEADMSKQRAEALDMAKDDKASRSGDDVTFNGHYYSKVWKTYGRGRRLLSLAAPIETFTGGAHGNMAFDALLWDRQAAAPVAVADLFTDRARAFELLGQIFCQRLDRERAERRGEELPLKDSGDFMTLCPPLAEQAVVPLDRDDGVFESLLVLIPPYTAGPYAEGSYEVEIELTDEMRRLMKPAFRGDF